MHRSRLLPALALCCALLVVPLLPVDGADAARNDGVTVAAAGLTNPRGFTWNATGDLVVAEAGVGGDNPANGEMATPAPVGAYTGGATARVVDASGGCPVPLADGLPSALSATGEAIGVADVALLGDTLYALVSGGGAAHGNPDQPNGVYRIDGPGETELVADLGAWLRANPVAHVPEADFDPEGSFYAMAAAAAGDALWVVESNSEQVLRVTAAGEVSRVADLSADNQVPTAIAPAPDGAVYVAQLTSAPFPAGAASVQRIGADGAVSTVWSGLTAVTGLTVAPDGTLYAAQLSETRENPPFFKLASGSVVRQTGEASAEVVASGLNLPVALRFGPDGGLYVGGPALGAAAGTGMILRIDPAAAPVAVALDALTMPDCSGAGDVGDGTGGAAGGDDHAVPTQPSDGTGGAGSGGQSGSGSTSELVVRIYDFGFDPPTLRVTVGSEVIWANTGATVHTVVSVVDGAAVLSSGELPPGGLFTFTFTEPGTYTYACTIHPEMTGTIIVE